MRATKKIILQFKHALSNEVNKYRSNYNEEVKAIDTTASFNVDQLKIKITNDMWNVVQDTEVGSLLSSILAKMPTIRQILLENDEELKNSKFNDVIDFVFKNLNAENVRLLGIFNYNPQDNVKRIAKLTNVVDLFLSNVSPEGLDLVEHNVGLANLTIYHCDQLGAKDFTQISIEPHTSNHIAQLETSKHFTDKLQLFKEMR